MRVKKIEPVRKKGVKTTAHTHALFLLPAPPRAPVMVDILWPKGLILTHEFYTTLMPWSHQGKGRLTRIVR